MDPLLPRRAGTSAWISGIEWRAIPTDSAAERRDTARGHHLVPAQPLADGILASVVRRHHPPNSLARPEAYSSRGGEPKAVNQSPFTSYIRSYTLLHPSSQTSPDPLMS